MALQEVGVEAVVKGLAAFQGDMRKINQSLQGLRGEGTLLQRAFGGITEGILNFGAHVARVAEVALGVLLRDAIRAAIDFVRELVDATIDAGNEFQVLEIRLGRLNLNQLKEDVGDYVGIGEDAAKVTQEQLKWLTLLAAKSPYDATDVAQMFTMIRTYGFAGDAAKDLTKDILEFTAGMGLTAVEAKRITVNFGQMVQQGKVTQRELNDLARGAFVPVNDILKRVSENTGVAMDDMDDFRKTGESVGAFFEAFSQIVRERFGGSMEDMSNTFRAATDNILDLVKGIFGLNTVKPILDVLGKRAADFANSFTDDPKRWDQIVYAAQQLGQAFSRLVDALFDLAPSTDDLIDKVLIGIIRLSNWLNTHREDIVAFVQGFIESVGNMKDRIVEFIEGKVIPVWNKLSAWYDEHKDLIAAFFWTIGEIAKEFFSDLTGGGKEGEGVLEGFLYALTDLMIFVINNKDEITKWVEVLWSLFAVWQVVGTVLSIVGGLILSIGGFVLGLVAAFSGFVGIVELAGSVLTALIGVLGTLITTIIGPLLLALGAAVLGIAAIKFIILQVIESFNWWKKTIESWFELFSLTIKRIRAEFIQGDWPGVGKQIVQGIANGIKWFAGTIADAARTAARTAFESAKAALGIHSPSTLFFEIGASTMEGMAMGIQKSAGLAAATMQGAMARVASSAVPSVTNSNVYNNTANYNLTVNSSAPQEPIVQDFNMMSSLAGV